METEDKVLDHGNDFDGIVELDNELPRWWLGIFWVTILFALFYVPYYHWFNPDQLPEAKYETAMAALEATKEEADQVLNTEQPGEDLEATLQAEYAAGGWAEAGNADFQTFCMPCHAADGGGTIGPNFTDDYYIHGGRLTDIMNTIINGVPEKGMISWKASLKPEQIKNLTFYIRSLRGTTPAVAKDPQGRKVDEAGNFIEEEAE